MISDLIYTPRYLKYSPKETYIKKNVVEITTTPQPFKIYYTDSSKYRLQAKKSVIRDMLMVGDAQWKIAEDVLYAAARELYGRGVERTIYNSSACDVIVQKKELLIEISIRVENPLTESYIMQKKEFRDTYYPDYNLIIIGNFSKYTYEKYRKGRNYIFARSISSKFPLFHGWYLYEFAFKRNARDVVKITRNEFKEKIKKIIESF